MFTRVIGRATPAFVIGLTLVLVAIACAEERERTETAPDATGLPADLTDARRPPDPELLLPSLPGYATDDADAGELEASLDHGEVRYVEVRRRLIVDEQAFAVGEVVVVTAERDSGGGESYLDHGTARRRVEPVELAGVEMRRVEAEPHAALAWVGPTFVVTFERGQERSDEWLEGLARATVEAIADGEARGGRSPGRGSRAAVVRGGWSRCSSTRRSRTWAVRLQPSFTPWGTKRRPPRPTMPAVDWRTTRS